MPCCYVSLAASVHAHVLQRQRIGSAQLLSTTPTERSGSEGSSEIEIYVTGYGKDAPWHIDIHLRGLRVRATRPVASFDSGGVLRVNKVQNPKQLYVISLAKIRKIVSFWQICVCAAGENYDSCEIFGALD